MTEAAADVGGDSRRGEEGEEQAERPEGSSEISPAAFEGEGGHGHLAAGGAEAGGDRHAVRVKAIGFELGRGGSRAPRQQGGGVVDVGWSGPPLAAAEHAPFAGEELDVSLLAGEAEPVVVAVAAEPEKEAGEEQE